VYWVRLPVREADRAFDVLADLTLRPLLRSDDIARERDIIVEEIRSYRDDPGQFVFNIWDEAYFGDTPLGWEIAGDEATVQGLTDTDVRDFWAAGYRPSNLVVAVAGDIAHDDAVGRVDQAFGRGDGVVPGWPAAPSVPAERVRIEHRETSQAHVCLGIAGLPRDHEDQWALELLNTILGEGTSSRLFLKVREEDGLAYDVHSFQTDYSDCGLLQVYLGVDPDDVVPALRSVVRELARLRDEPVPDAELEKVRNYTTGRLEMRLEESRAMASFLGGQEALHDRVMSMDEVIDAIRGVTASEIQELAGRLIRDEAICAAVVGPKLTARGLDRALRLP
jgi:predicted Zn-dependent peptidase